MEKIIYAAYSFGLGLSYTIFALSNPSLKKGKDQVEVREISIEVKLDDLKVYNPEKGDWLFEEGMYQFYTGTSSEETDLSIVEIELTQK